MTGRDLYVPVTDPAGKHRDVINHHRVWDADLFIASLQEQYTGDKVKAKDVRIVSIATKEEYDANRRKGGAA